MSLSGKIKAIVDELLRRIGLRILSSCIAPDFDPAEDYSPGQLVMYREGTGDSFLYVCKENGHAHGDWTFADFKKTNIDEVLSNIRIDGEFPEELHIKAANGDNKYHKVVVRNSGSMYTLAVDQDGKNKQ